MPPDAIVRAYDIRGTTPDQINPAIAEQLGRAFAQWLADRGATSLLIAHDTRATSPALYAAAISGALSAGLNVHAVGLAPTPVAGWEVDRAQLSGGMIVTASHNPPEYNGFKLLAESAQPLLPEEIREVAELTSQTTTSAARGRRIDRDAINPYLDMLRSRFSDVTDVRAAIDCGSGTTALTAPLALRDSGAQLHAIHSTPMPVRELAADPQNPETMHELARTVRALDADIGIAWDGDGDRIGVLDHLGRRYEADWLTAVLARPLLHRRSGAAVLLDMKTSSSVIEDIECRGGRPLTTRTGYSFFRRQMREQQIAFGGETSGHLMFGPDYRDGEHAPFIDDGVYAACALLDYLAKTGRSLAEEMSEIQPRPISPELRLPCPDSDKHRIADAIATLFHVKHQFAVVNRDDGARIQLEHGWAHARASNTAPALSLRFEAVDQRSYRELAEQLYDALRQHPEVEQTDSILAEPTIGPQLLD